MMRHMIAFLLCLSLLSAAAPTALGETATTDNLPAVGAVLHGFRVKEYYTIDNLATTCVLMEHEKTGAELIWMANDVTERSFSITFKTPANDDKGIPHVFEHSTLCGSTKYPEPSLFFAMISNTYNTFLNAMTFPNCTSYPSASLSEEQLYRFVDYYLSGVFYPLIMTDEHAMMREAYRYELADRDSDITLSGTVYSEMQGAISQIAQAQYNLQKQLYPNSNLSTVAGGLPADIPSMTYQDLKDFHDAYYHPSNALMVLFGKVDIDRFLGLIDGEYLSKFDKREIVIEDSNYVPTTGYTSQIYEFPVAAGTPEQTYAYYGITMRGLSQEDRCLMANLANYIDMSGMPLDTLMRERLPGVTAQVLFSDASAEPTLMIVAVGLSISQVDAFKAIVDEALAQTFAEGSVDRQKLHDLVNKVKYNDRMIGEKNSVGITYSQNICTDWATFGSANAYQVRLDVTNRLDEYIDAGAFERICTEHLLHPVNAALAVTTTKDGGLEERDAALKQSLKEMKDAMTDEELDALIARTADFAAWTEANKNVTLLDEVRAVEVSTLPEETKAYTAEDSTVDGIRYVTCEADTAGVATVEVDIDTSFLTPEELPLYALAVTLIKQLPTENVPLDDLLLDFASTTMYNGTLSIGTLDYKDSDYVPVLRLKWKCFDENVNAAFDLMEEALLRTKYDDLARVRQYAIYNAQTTRMIANMMPDLLCTMYGSEYLDEQKRYSSYVTGDAYEALLGDIGSMTDDELTALLAKAQAVLRKALNRNGLVITCVGDRAAIDAVTERGQAFAATLDDTVRERVDLSGVLIAREQPLAITVDGTMQYNMQLMSTKGNALAESGKCLALSSLVYDKLLIPILRFENSAYGAGAAIDKNSMYVISKRDPNLVKTYDTYQTLGDRLRALECTQEELDGYIFSAYTKLAMPYGPIAGGTTAVSDKLLGEDSFAETLRKMREIKQFTPEDVKTLAALFDQLAEKGARITVGGTQAIEEARETFKTIDTRFTE